MWWLIALITASQGAVVDNWLSGGDKSVNSVLGTNMLPTIRNPNLSSLRVLYDFTDNFVTVSVPAVSILGLENAAEKSKWFFGHQLDVYPLTSQIIASPSSPTLDCGDGILIKTATYSNTDVVILVRGYNDPSSEKTGFSQVCHLDNTKNAPLVGIISINNDKFSGLTSHKQWTFVAHLSFLVLGFAEKLTPYWKTTAGLPYSNVFTTVNVRDTVPKKLVITPLVVAATQSVFADPSALGLEREEFPDPLAPNADFWDSKMMHNDIMCIRSINTLIISTITLAAMEDTGFYKRKGCGQDPIFGQKEGCSFTSKKCINSSKQSIFPELYCTTDLQSACDAFNLNKGVCNMPSGISPLIYTNEMRYFGTGDIGGGDKYTDYCPYVIPVVSGLCRTSATTKNGFETAGPNSRCLVHSINKFANNLELKSKAGCFDINCLPNGDAQIKEGVTVLALCPKTGGYVQFSQTIGTDVYNGYFYCPKNGLCGDLPCTNTCNGRGCCEKGVCKCDPGYKGTDCDEPCPTGCVDCTSTCCNTCADGFYKDGCTCRPCDTCCSTCTAAGLNSCVLKSNLKYTYNSKGEKIGCADPIVEVCQIPGGATSTSCCPNCLRCAFDNCCNCLECEAGYFITTDGQCTNQCLVNCERCSSPTVCSDCKKGFDLTEDGRCVRCPDGCLDCVRTCPNVCGAETGCSVDDFTCFDKCYSCSTNVCTACITGWTKSGNICVKICPPNCRDCRDDATKCKSCNGGFYLSSSSSLCEACETSCSSCDYVSLTETTCNICRVSFFKRQKSIGSANYDCINCEAGCYKCTSETDCSACQIRWYLSGSDCLRCEYGCRSCVDSSTCTVADSGFYITSTNGVARCHKSCETCDADLVCNTCKIGFYFYYCSSENCLCRDCEDNCAKCVSLDQCLLCRVGWYLNTGNTCSKCDSLCYTCERAGECLTCISGYYLDAQKQCQKCGLGCDRCVSGTRCVLCKPGWWPDEFGCQLCEANCAYCYTGNDCYICKLGWYLDAGNHCQKCDTNCIRCTLTDKCLVCKVGFYPVSGICVPCGSNCAFCTSNTDCTICNSGFYLFTNLDKTHQCRVCQNGCADCCDELTCMKAKSGWWLDYFPGIYRTDGGVNSRGTQNSGQGDDGGKVAVSCVASCTDCSSLTTCRTCASRFYLSGYDCIACKSPCLLCKSDNSCLSCVSRFRLEGDQCVACPSNCFSCNIDGCIMPDNGYYVNPDNKKEVLPCLLPCQTCIGKDNGKCLTCKAGYGETSITTVVDGKTLKTCNKCKDNCNTCSNENFCTSAKTGFYVDGGIVTNCPDNTNSCTYKNNRCEAITCKSGSYLSIIDKTCRKCLVLNCAKCKEDNKCDVCNPKFYKDPDEQCIKCDTTCYNCKDDPISCTSCNTGSYLNSNLCIKCPLGCRRCNSEIECTLADTKYYLDSNKVATRCMDKCNICTDNASCTTCESGYYWKKSVSPLKCEICPSNCSTCFELNENDTVSVKCSACREKAKTAPLCI